MIIHNRIKLLGDPHVGRHFVRNVPLHRRGDRERLVWEKFEAELDPAGCAYHICMGDLFDNDKVSFNTIVRAARLYLAAADEHPQTDFYVLAGNHDLSRDLEHISAFELFSMIIGRDNNVTCVTQPMLIENMVLNPWNPLYPARDMIAHMPGEIYFGHNDVDLRSDPFNLLPTPELAKLGFKEAYTGHVHLPTTFDRDGVKVTVVGSMLPYAHGEDATGETYVTLGLDEIGDHDLTNKCVRIRLKPGEVFDQQLDCLQLQIEREGAAEAEELDVSLGDFDLQKIFDSTVAEFNIPDSIVDQLRDKWRKAFSSEA